MDFSLFPTKGNLIVAKNTLKLSRQGYELLDKKRTILINEMMSLIKTADELQAQIDVTFKEAYAALQNANIAIGISSVWHITGAIPIEDDINIRFKSVMGVEVPEVTYEKKDLTPAYGFLNTGVTLDEAYKKFDKVRKLTINLAMIENAVYRLATNIKRTQKRANALKNIIIPRYQNMVIEIQNVLEEKDREDFTRLKVIKNQKLAERAAAVR